MNESDQIIRPITGGGNPVFQSVITDAKGLPGKTCGVGLLTKNTKGHFVWSSLPGTSHAHGKTVTITNYNAPHGFEIPPKTPLHFGVNCY